MAEASLRFYEELNDYLPAGKRKRDFSYLFKESTDIRQMLRILDVPESEVEMVLVNGSSAALSDRLTDGDRISVYPVFESVDVGQLLRIREAPLRSTRFTLDRNLRRLAWCLRLLGFDARFFSCMKSLEKEKRILLTADPRASEYGLSRVYVVRQTKTGAQLREVLSRFDLFRSTHLSYSQNLLISLLANRK